MFSIPAVQTVAANRLTDYLNAKLGTEIKIDKVAITYDAAVKLKGVYIGDHHNDTLISAQSLKTSLINIPGLLSGDNIDFGSVTATHLTFRLRRYKEDEKDSFGIFLDKLSSNNPNKEGARIKFSHLNIIDSKFSFTDWHNQNPHIISLTHLDIDASDFIIDDANIYVTINGMSGYGSRGIHFTHVSTRFALTENQMNFDDFQLKTEQTDLKSNIHFSFDHTMADFANKVQVEADFKKSVISSTDLKKLFDKFGVGEKFTFQGKLTGTLNDFKLKDIVLNGMSGTAAEGKMTFKNIFGEKDFHMEGIFENLQTNYHDLVNLLPGILRGKLPESLNRLGVTKLRGNISVTKSMIGTNAVIKSKLGWAIVNALLNNLQSTDNQTYQGQIYFRDFDLGQFLNNPDLGTSNFSFILQGKGFSSKNLNTTINGTFNSLNFHGYTYHNIRVNGRLRAPIFTGEVISYDPNLLMHFNGSADVSGQTNNYDFSAMVTHADFHTLNFIKDSVGVFKGNVTMNLKGHNIDDITGNITLNNASYRNIKDTYHFKKLSLNSSYEGVVRKITINSPDIINGKIQGNFVLTQVPALFKNAVLNLYANYKPTETTKNQYLYFDIAIHNKIVQAIFPTITLAPNTFIRGKVRSGNSALNLVFKSPEIKIGKNRFEQVNLEMDNTDPLHTTHFDVDSVMTGSYPLSKVHIISKLENDTLYIRSEFKGGVDNTDQFNINLFHTINKKNQSVLGIRRSNLKFKNATWFLNKDKKKQTIVFDNDLKNIKMDTLIMSYKNQRIALSGYKHGNKNLEFALSFLDVDLAEVVPTLSDFNFGGILNGNLEVVQKKGFYYPSSDLTVSGFQVNDIDYGDLTINIAGNNSLTSYKVKASLAGKQVNYFTADGEINVGHNNPSINLEVALNQFNIGVLNAFGNGVIANVRGKANGHAHVHGSYKHPMITGNLYLQDAGLKIPYLNVDLAFKDDAEVKLSKQQFYFDHVDFEDTKYHTQGQIDGTISHYNFRDWQMNLNLLAPNRLLVLDTKYAEDVLYYGTAFISGRAHIQGPFNELVIDVSATSEKGTVFKIPLSDAESVSKSSYIYFLTPEDKKAKKAGKDIVIKKLKGLELNFDLDVTNDANIEIVIDQKSGSTLRGSGAGTLLMEINTNGKFNMWGDFVIYQGIYDFKYAGLIQKEFKVVSGGSITWDGSPMRANLNVKALYETHANPAALLQNPTMNRSIPVDVYIELTGLLTNVNINFELAYPNLSSVVKSELEYRISTQENTEIQALSLIAQGSFYSTLGAGGNAHPENLLFQRAAGLFNDIFSDAGDKFKVGVNYTKGSRVPNQENSDRVGVTLSTNVSDRILINGRVGVPLGGLTQSVLVGNIEIELLLNQEGTLRAKLFNRENDIQYIGEELGYTQGIGISYSVDFDTFKELIHKILNKKITLSDISKEVEEAHKKKDIVPDYIKFPQH